MTTQQKGTIYLEPRQTWDRAIIDQDNIIYSMTTILDILMEDLVLDYFEAIDFYCFNIEPLTLQGLAVLDEEGE